MYRIYKVLTSTFLLFGIYFALDLYAQQSRPRTLQSAQGRSKVQGKSANKPASKNAPLEVEVEEPPPPPVRRLT
ncbi:MAG: hypothetical protein ACRD4L_10690, partial [Pyrinomonadaceae bacterium]